MPYLIADIIFDRHRGNRRFIAGEIERIKKDLDLSPGPNSGGIIWGTGDTLYELSICKITP